MIAASPRTVRPVRATTEVALIASPRSWSARGAAAVVDAVLGEGAVGVLEGLLDLRQVMDGQAEPVDARVGDQLHLAHQLARDQHGAALVGEAAQQGSDSAHAVEVQAVDRLVEEQDRRAPGRRRGEDVWRFRADRRDRTPGVRRYVASRSRTAAEA
jgi:hypothetical protein